MHIILCLGGDFNRNRIAAALACGETGAKVLVSSEGSPASCASIYAEYGVEPSRVFYDYHAWDTVTNFTETYSWIKQQGCTKLTVVTDDFHMKRSLVIARNVYAFRPVEIAYQKRPTDRGPEPEGYVGWDRLRSLWWRLTGQVIDNGDRDRKLADIKLFESEALALGLQVIR